MAIQWVNIRDDTIVQGIAYAPKKIHIKADDVHAMSPLSDYVVLFYQFVKTPFSNIKYTYLKSYL